jgi:polyisoprenoid-binding protein YceI
MPAPWTIDQALTTAGFAVSHVMLTTVRGGFKDVKKGEVLVFDLT